MRECKDDRLKHERERERERTPDIKVTETLVSAPLIISPDDQWTEKVVTQSLSCTPVSP